MANLRAWIVDAAGDEEIESVVIGQMGWGEYKSESVPNYNDIPKGRAMPWEEAMKWLDYEFDDGVGAPRCQAVYAWTATKVIAIGQYDGSTFWYTIPRNPTDIMPEMAGG